MKDIIIRLKIILFILLLLSCNNKNKKEQNNKEKGKSAAEVPFYIKIVNNKNERMRLWRAAIDSGDFKAYNKIAFVYLMTDREVDLYYYSLIMANKYHCPEAYFNMSLILTSQASTGDMILLSNDKDTKNLAHYYLFKAKELGFSGAQFSIDNEFDKSKPLPNSSFFLKELMKP